MVLSVLTMKWNYEIFSSFKLTLCEKGKDIYIFTALNEETLQLAKSIKNNEKYKKVKRQKRKKCIIIFSGPEFDAFDRNDDLCRQLIAEGFLYRSYYKSSENEKNKKGKSIARILKLNNKNIRRGEFKDSRLNRFCIFAYDSKNHIPEEENNVGFVFDDIEARINAKKRDSLRIEYYVLTKRDINYQAYDYKNRELILQFSKTLRNGRNGKNNKDELTRVKAQAFEKFWKEMTEQKSYDNIELVASVKNATQTLFNGLCDKILGYTSENNKNGEQDIFKDYLLTDGVCSVDKLNDEEFKSEFEKLSIGDRSLNKIKKNLFSSLSKILIGEFSEYAVVSAVNETHIISKDAISDLTLPFETCGYEEKRELGEKLVVYVLGFGSTGQAIAKAIHMRSSYINAAGYAVNTHFEVFDGKANDIGGLFAKEHPMWICASDDSIKKYETEGKTREQTISDFYEEKRKKKIEKIYKSKLSELKGQELEDYKKQIDKEIVFPTIYFNSTSCFDLSILDKLDNVTGAQRSGGGVEEWPAVIALALGSDYDNVKMANALIADIKRESLYSDEDRKQPYPQTIIVNIWDSHNNGLIDSAGGVWEDNHTKLYMQDANLIVRIVGNNTDIYSYKYMAYHEDSAEYDAGYKKMSDDVDKNDESMENMKKFIVYDDESAGFDKLKIALDKIKKDYPRGEKNNREKDEIMQGYEKIDMWKRESSDSVKDVAFMFSNINSILQKKHAGEEESERYVKICVELARIEHQRWLRHHIANGWIYAKEKKMLLKQHKCIAPFKTTDDACLYDMVNVIKIFEDIKELGKDKSEDVLRETESGNIQDNCAAEDIQANQEAAATDYDDGGMDM